MRLYSFQMDGRPGTGAEFSGALVDLRAGYEAMRAARGSSAGSPRSLPADMLSLLSLGAPGFEAVRDTLAFARRRPALPVGQRLLYSLDEATLLAPVPRPGKIILGFPAEYALSRNLSIPSSAPWVAKLPNTVVGTQRPIIAPRHSSSLTFASGVAAIVGQILKYGSIEDAMGAICGFTLLNHISAPTGSSDPFRTANFDTFCPMGPCLVTRDEFGKPNELEIRCKVNGKAGWIGTLEAPVATLARLLQDVSHVMTLEPGDIVALILGPPTNGDAVRIQGGDAVLLDATPLGCLQNTVQFNRLV